MERGIAAFVVPEGATKFFTGGVNLSGLAPGRTTVDFQRALLRNQLQEEDAWVEMARLHQGAVKVVLCDRAVMDTQAYIGPALFEAMIQDLGCSLTYLKNGRYDAVFHLVSAAKGAEEFYNNDNEARKEGIGEARALDDRTMNAWLGHEHLKIIPNEMSSGGRVVKLNFEQKMEMLLQEVFHSLGLPEPLETERKFRVSHFLDPVRFPVGVVRTGIQQIYLRPVDANTERRVRMLVPEGFRFSGQPLYVYTEKTGVTGMTRVERETSITATEFERLLMEKDSKRGPIRKNRYSFVYNHQYFHLDEFIDLDREKLVEIEVSDESAEIDWPPFLGDKEEVTTDENYKNANLALKLTHLS
jgi:CYTH domain-containing protein